MELHALEAKHSLFASVYPSLHLVQVDPVLLHSAQLSMAYPHVLHVPYSSQYPVLHLAPSQET